MHPRDCKSFEYNNHPRRGEILKAKVTDLLARLRRANVVPLELAQDTRSIHFELFSELLGDCPAYYAGHYRGEEYRCLRHYSVNIASDPRVGYPPKTVLQSMAMAAELIKTTIAGLDVGNALPDSQMPREVKMAFTVAVACRIFELVLRIHPYTNGNGHIARYCIWVLLGRYNFWPQRWPIDPRPPDPPYTQLIVDHRDGIHQPLEEFVLSCI